MNLVGDVAADRDRPAADGFDLGHRLVGDVLVAGVPHGESHAVGGEPLADGTAYTA